jgi:hypothetical protein
VVPFLASRLLLLAAGWFGRYFEVTPQPSSWLHLFSKWDGAWYVRIAVEGYRPGFGQQSIAFFPLYPLLIRFAGHLWPGEPSQTKLALVAVVLSNLLALPALFAVARLAEAITNDQEIAQRTVLLLIAYPASMYMSFAYSESLYVLVLALAFLFATKGAWLRAGIMIGLATACRPTGILAMPVLLWMAWVQWRRGLERPWRLLALGLGPLGFLAVAYNAARVTGELFSIFSVQKSWGRHWATVQETFMPLAYPEPHVDLFNRVFIALFVVLVIGAWLYRPTRMLAPYATLCMIPVLFSGTLMSSTRLLLPQLPCLIVAAAGLRREALMTSVLGLLFGLQALFMLGWSAGRFVG